MPRSLHPTALVTGANRGIGRAIAAGLKARGCTVTLGARSVAEGRAAAAELGVAFARIDLADPVDAARDQPGRLERPVVLRDEDRDLGLGVSQFPPLPGEHVDVEIGRGEDHVFDLCRNLAAPDRHLPQRFHGQP